jgi:hypothetical protein
MGFWFGYNWLEFLDLAKWKLGRIKVNERDLEFTCLKIVYLDICWSFSLICCKGNNTLRSCEFVA